MRPSLSDLNEVAETGTLDLAGLSENAVAGLRLCDTGTTA